MLGLKSGGIDEYELRVLVGEYALNAVARSLRLREVMLIFCPIRWVEAAWTAHVGAARLISDCSRCENDSGGLFRIVGARNILLFSH